MTARGPRSLLVTSALVLTLTACAGTDEPTAAAQASAAPSSSSESSAPSAAPGTPAGQRIEVTVASGEVSGDTGRVSVAAGEQVTLVVTSDVADEIHLHGYDLTAAVAPGTPAEIPFEATVPGVFEVELHEAGTVLLTLQVG